MLMVATRIDLPINIANIQNSFLMEKCYIIVGSEFEHNKDRIFVAKRDLCGINYSNASFWDFMD